MADPTETQIQTKLKHACILVKDLIKYAGVNSPSFNSDQTTLLGDAVSDYDAELEAAVSGLRAQIDGAIQGAGDVLAPILRAYAKVTKFAETDANGILAQLYNWFVFLYPGSSQVSTVVSRQFNYGAVQLAVGGDGTCYRLTKDPYGYDLEATWTQQVAARCVLDQGLGAVRHEERWEVRADAAARDELIRLGSGTLDVENFRGMSARDSILLNCSFEACTPTPAQGASIAPTANPTGWNLDVLATYQLTQDQYYRDFQGLQVGSTSNPPVALRFTTNGTICALLKSRNVPLQPLRPYLISVPVFRESVCDGTLTLTLGSLAPFAPTTAPTATLSGSAGSVDNGNHTYAVTFVGPYGESLIGTSSSAVAADGTHAVSLTGIPVGTGQNMTGDQSVIKRNVYRSKAGTTTPLYLVTTLSDNFTTTFSDTAADSAISTLPPSTLPTSSGTQNIVTKAVNTLANGSWSLVQFPLDQNLYYKNFMSDGLALSIALTGRTTGSAIVDEVGVWPFQPFAGTWAVFVGGRTPFRYNDKLKWTDTALGSVVQEILWRSFGRYLPAIPANPPASPAMSVADGAAGNVTAGSHVWGVTFIGNPLPPATTPTGMAVTESGLGALVTFVATGAKHASITSVPLGGTGITARRIYRTKAGVPGTYYYVGQILDNVTTTFDDNLADGSIGFSGFSIVASQVAGATIQDT